MSDDDLNSRMLSYQMPESNRRFMPLLPVIARVDGRSFSKFTADLDKPFDEKFSRIMVQVTKFLVRETEATIGYTQSDEITLIWLSSNTKQQIFFDGRIQKIVSTVAALTTLQFNKQLTEHLPAKQDQSPTFDCRAWTVPNKTEAINTLIWRQQDATKNSISMAAQTYFDHYELINKTGSQKQDMLMDKQINWNNYPATFKRGTFIGKQKIQKKFTVEETAALPEKHQARLDPNLKYERTEIKELELPILTKIINKEDVIFKNANPKILGKL